MRTSERAEIWRERLREYCISGSPHFDTATRDLYARERPPQPDGCGCFHPTQWPGGATYLRSEVGEKQGNSEEDQGVIHELERGGECVIQTVGVNEFPTSSLLLTSGRGMRHDVDSVSNWRRRKKNSKKNKIIPWLWLRRDTISHLDSMRPPSLTITTTRGVVGRLIVQADLRRNVRRNIF